MRRLLLLLALCMALALMFVQVAVAQTRGPSGADGTYNCEDFDDQGQAQEFSLGDPGDTNGLDEDGDGIVCESLPTVTPEGIVEGPGEDQYRPSETQYETEIPTTSTASPTAELPDTGGISPALTLAPVALLIASGLLALRIIRR